MAVLTLNKITTAGITGTYVAATVTGDSFPSTSDQRVFFHAKNAGSAPVTLTFLAQTATEKVPGVGTIAVQPLSATVPAAGDCMAGPFPRDYVGANGQVQVAYSAVASLTVAAYSVTKADGT